jgi:hypothetical protein
MFLRSGNRLRALSSPPLLGTSQVADDQSGSVSSYDSEVTDTCDGPKASLDSSDEPLRQTENGNGSGDGLRESNISDGSHGLSAAESPDGGFICPSNYARPVSRSSNNSIASNEQYFPSWFADVDSLVTLRTRNYFLRVFRVTTSVSLADSARGRFSLPNRT